MSNANVLIAGSCAAMACGAWLAGEATAQAVNRRQYQQQQQQVMVLRLEPVDLKGTIQRAAPGVIGVETEQLAAYLVKVDPRKTMVRCKGTADPSFLRPGLLLRFTGEFDKRGTTVEDVKELDIVTASATTRPGIYPEGLPEEAEGAPRKPVKKAANEGGRYLVVGMLRGIKQNEMQISAPGANLRVGVADDVEIKVDAWDLSFVQQGDKVEVKGKLAQEAQGPQPGQVYGDEITVELAQPLSAQSTVGKKPGKDAGKLPGKKNPDAEPEKPAAEKPKGKA